MTRLAGGNPCVTLHAPETVSTGKPVQIFIRVQNKSAEPLTLYLRGREATYDFVVTARDGGTVWRRLEGEIVPAILRLEVLGPGQTLEFGGVWPQRDNGGELVAPGSYTIRGTVLSDGSAKLESPAISLRITRR